MARRCERRHVSHLAAGRYRERGVSRQPEDVLQPVAGDLLDHHRRRPEGTEPGALIPDRREPVGPDARGKCAARDVPEVASPCGRDDAALDLTRHQLDDVQRVRGRSGKRPSERLRDVLGRVLREHRTLGEGVEEVAGELGGAPQQTPLVGHGWESTFGRLRRSPRRSGTRQDLRGRSRGLRRPGCVAREEVRPRAPRKRDGSDRVILRR